MERNFLIETFEPGSFLISKPKQHKTGSVMTCKVRDKSKEQVFIQFPKMNTVSDYTNCMEVEFSSESGYSKKVIAFMERLDAFVMDLIFEKSMDWFGKTIPKENIELMYKRSIVDKRVKIVFEKSRSELVDKQNQSITLDQIVKENVLEAICMLKYIVFTKDTCFLHWEVAKAKLYKKIKQTEHFAFIEDPDDESDDDFEETITFF
jgi:hypothetical protein